MKRIAIVIAAALTFAATLPTTPALAQPAKRTFVSAIGSDSNICTVISSPCRTFGAAYALTIPEGEINVLDPAGYGTLTITHGLSIQGRGWASITAQSGNAITITAGPSDNIYLQGLLLDGAGTGANGIVLNTGKSLIIDHCVVRDLTNNGIAFQPNASSSLIISDTFVANSKGGNGIVVAPTGSGAVTAVFTRVEADNNGDGMLVDSTLYLGTEFNTTAADSVAAGNSGAGFKVNSNGTGLSLMMFHSVAANNGTGITAQGNSATLRVGQSTVTGNASGWTALLGGVIQSYGDNYINNNGPNTGSLTPGSKQ
jgi:hypothetical protein